MNVTTSTRRVLFAVVAPLLVGIVVGIVLLWPSHVHRDATSDGAKAWFDATVTKVSDAPCDGTDVREHVTCSTARVRLSQGPDEGSTVELPEATDANGPSLHVGDDIVVGWHPAADEGFRYTFSDHERRTPIVLLAVAFALAVVALARVKGLRALAAIVASLVVLGAFVLPALADGRDPLLVALAGAGAVATVVVVIAHGVDAGATIALLGVLTSLALVGVVSKVVDSATHLTGNGMLLAGTVIGAVGVLVDVTTRQVRAVAGRTSTREHVGSAMTTLVLAYAGASLPVLLLLTQSDQSLFRAVGSEAIASEIVRAIVGALGLVAAIPITTVVAVWALNRYDERAPRPNDPREYRSRAERDLWD